jgi:hypothetical protein
MKSALFSWKSTAGGVIVLAVPLAYHFGYLTMEQAGAITVVATAFGLIAAKDSNVSGGTKQQ